jgi:uncharacterized protein YprB with RNaseH-like and TPR domain
MLERDRYMNRLDLYRKGHSGASDRRPPPTGGSVERLHETIGGEIVSRGSQSVLHLYENIPYSQSPFDTEFLHVLFPAAERKATPGDLLFFDVETTGLSGGAGTVVFLIGFLTVGKHGLDLHQFFLNTLSSERLFLEQLDRIISTSGFFVSYNGKSFDFNIIRNRFVMQGMRFNGEGGVHLDLLYTSRRLWRGMLPDYRLGTVEEYVLNTQRTGDVPGWRVPEIYSDFLRGRDTVEDMKAVFYHNRKDVLSLFSLLGIQLQIIAQAGSEPSSGQPGTFMYNPVSVSGFFTARRYRHKAVDILTSHRENAAALKSLAMLHKKDSRFRQSIDCFEKLSEKRVSLSEFLFACTEIAKIYEHRLKDYDSALLYTDRMRSRLKRSLYFHPRERGVLEYELEKVHKRCTRLRRKIDRVRKEKAENDEI